MSKRIVPVLAGLAVLAPVAAWAAWAPGAPAEATLAKGKPWMEVLSDPQGAAAMVHGAIEVDVPPASVMATVLDCGQAMKITPDLKSCRVIQHDAKDHWDLREQVTQASPLPKIHVTVRYDLDAPHGFTFKQTGGDMRVLEGGWRFEPLDGGTRTRVVYWNRMAPGLPIPGPLMRSVVRAEAPKALTGLKTVCEASFKQRTARP